MTVVAFDTETDLLAPGNTITNFVCVQTGIRTGPGDEGIEVELLAKADPYVAEFVEELLKGDHLLVGHNVAFDMAVLLKAFPQHSELVWRAYCDERVTCTRIREKLRRLSDNGDLKFDYLPDGSRTNARFSMDALVKKHLHEDISASKNDPDGYRMRYVEVMDKPSAEWEKDRRDYALADGFWTLKLYEKQELLAPNAHGPLSMATQFFQTQVDFALYLQTAWGIRVNLAARDKLILEVEQQLTPDKLSHLIESGVLRASDPPRIRSNQVGRARRILEDLIGFCPEDFDDFDAYRDLLQAHSIHWTQGKPGSINTTKLRARVEAVCKEHDIEVQETETGKVSTDHEMLLEIAGFDPVIDEYIHRQSLQKLVTTELPAMRDEIVHPGYDVLKMTGRTSSYGERKGRPGPYASTNIQQKDPRVRHCYIPREGHCLVSVDYSSLELCTAAQKQIDLFGRSHLADIINDGKDPHAYLGANMALRFDEAFCNTVKKALHGKATRDDLYAYFKAMEESDDEAVRDFYWHYRTFAKPTGLGLPGGLGAKTFITYAKGTYDVDLVKVAGGVEAAAVMAVELKNLWLDVFPEFQLFFDWVSEQCVDTRNGEIITKKGKRMQTYAYSSPFGMYRAGAPFTAAANGSSLQTPAAEGAKTAVWWLSNACYRKPIGSLLYGCRPVGFIHDEILTEVPLDEHLHARAFGIADLMIEAMKEVVKDVKISAEPAAMLWWDKKAKCVLDEQGKLKVWTP